MKEIAYRIGNRYILYADYVINVGIKGLGIDSRYLELSPCGLLTIKKGYAWNGANVVSDTNSIMRGSLVHDALYQLIRLKLLPYKYKATADLLLKQICLEDGMHWLRAWYVHRAVKRWGRFCARPGSEAPEQIHYAPEDD